VILGNSERFAILLFLPWIIEALLKLRGRFAVRSFGDLQKDGTVKAPYDKIYSLTHVAMKLPEWLKLKKKFTAEQVTAVLLFLIVLNSSVWTLHYVFFGRVN
jgi:UDP-N-acetylglucosamine--dolichyl-phosphate N-acetylglucosaminephosphotransferase